jgi:hypothetical protein
MTVAPSAWNSLARRRAYAGGAPGDQGDFAVELAIGKVLLGWSSRDDDEAELQHYFKNEEPGIWTAGLSGRGD